MNIMTVNWHVAVRPMESEDASGKSASVQFYQISSFVCVPCIAYFEIW